jgi:hypothetical protein
MVDLTGEANGAALKLDFDRRLMLQFRGSVITSDGGLLAYRELDDVLALTATDGEILADARTGKNGRDQLVGLLRQSVFGRLAGYEDVNDAERLCRDPAMRWVVGGRAPVGQAASASQMGRFETEGLTRPENFSTLADLPSQWIDKRTSGARRGSSCSTWIRARARPMASRKAAPTTATLAAPVIPRCSCSTSSVMWSDARYGRAIAQCRRLARGAGSGDRPLPGHGEAALFLRRCGFCQSRDLRAPRSREHGLCDPTAGEPGHEGQDRAPAQAPGRTTVASGSPLLCQLYLSGAELE